MAVKLLKESEESRFNKPSWLKESDLVTTYNNLELFCSSSEGYEVFSNKTGNTYGFLMGYGLGENTKECGYSDLYFIIAHKNNFSDIDIVYYSYGAEYIDEYIKSDLKEIEAYEN